MAEGHSVRTARPGVRITLGEIFEQHYRPARLAGASADVLKNYRKAIRQADLYCGGNAHVDDLIGRLDSFVAWLRETGRSGPTAQAYRRHVRAVVNAWSANGPGVLDWFCARCGGLRSNGHAGQEHAGQERLYQLGEYLPSGTAFRPDGLTLRAAYEAYLSPAHKDRTADEYFATLRHWEACGSLTAALQDAATKRRKLRDPDVRDVDNLTLFDFKNWLLKVVDSPNTVAKHLRHVRAIFNRIGPDRDGLAIISTIPYVTPPKPRRKPPTILTTAEVDALYRACDRAIWPRCEVPPADWWRSLIVALFNVGLRRLDFLKLAWSEVDLDAGVLTLEAVKTGKVSQHAAACRRGRSPAEDSIPTPEARLALAPQPGGTRQD